MFLVISSQVCYEMNTSNINICSTDIPHLGTVYTLCTGITEMLFWLSTWSPSQHVTERPRNNVFIIFKYSPTNHWLDRVEVIYGKLGKCLYGLKMPIMWYWVKIGKNISLGAMDSQRRSMLGCFGSSSSLLHNECIECKRFRTIFSTLSSCNFCSLD